MTDCAVDRGRECTSGLQGATRNTEWSGQRVAAPYKTSGLALLGLVLARPCKPDGHKECPDGTGRHTEREGGSMTNAAQHKAMAEQSGSRRAACERFVR